MHPDDKFSRPQRMGRKHIFEKGLVILPLHPRFSKFRVPMLKQACQQRGKLRRAACRKRKRLAQCDLGYQLHIDASRSRTRRVICAHWRTHIMTTTCSLTGVLDTDTKQFLTSSRRHTESTRIFRNQNNRLEVFELQTHQEIILEKDNILCLILLKILKSAFATQCVNCGK